MHRGDDATTEKADNRGEKVDSDQPGQFLRGSHTDWICKRRCHLITISAVCPELCRAPAQDGRTGAVSRSAIVE